MHSKAPPHPSNYNYHPTYNYPHKKIIFSLPTLQMLPPVYKLGAASATIITYTKFINSLTNNGYVDQAMEFFAFTKSRNYLHPDVSLYTLLVSVLSHSNRTEEARRLAEEMILTCNMHSLDLLAYNIAMNAFADSGNHDVVTGLCRDMIKNGVQPDAATHGAYIKSLCSAETIDKAKLNIVLIETFTTASNCRSRHDKLDKNTYPYNTLIAACLREGLHEKAHEVMTKMETSAGDIHPLPDVCTYNTFITHYARCGRVTDSIRVLKDMKHKKNKGVEPNAITYKACLEKVIKERKVTDQFLDIISEARDSKAKIGVKTWNRVLHWLGRLGRVDEACELFDDIIDRYVDQPDEVTINTMIHMLYKSGRGDAAWELFERMKKHASTTTYNIVVNGLGKEGKVKEARSLVSEMEYSYLIRKSVYPDLITYNSLLDGLCKAGKFIDEACAILGEMSMGRRSIQPDMVSYNTVINGLIREGRLEDANRLFKSLKNK